MARRHQSLIPLSHEHHDALMLAWRLRTGNLSKREPELRAKHVSAFFEYRLINHMRLEEELLFPACRAVLGVEALLIDVLLSDHRASGESRGHQGRRARPGGQFLRPARTPYPNRGTSTVRAGGGSDEADRYGGARTADKSAA